MPAWMARLVAAMLRPAWRSLVAASANSRALAAYERTCAAETVLVRADLATSGVPEFVEAERERLAASLDPQWQAAQWGQDPELSRRLDELGVDPVNLATSMLRVSSAWTAMLLESSGTHEGQEATRLSRVSYLELCLGRQLELAQVLFERPLTQWQREQQLEAISETLACLQLARMCAAVPEANLGVIVQHRDLLQPLLPAASALSGFEQRTESKATILQISGEQNAYAPFK